MIETDFEDETLEVGWWPTAGGSAKTPTWLRNSGALVLGVFSGIVLTIVCVVALVQVVSFFAVVIGPFVAAVIWLLVAASTTIGMRREGWTPAKLWFLAGGGIIPCFYAVLMLTG
ncbi:hypothetical protein [Nocardia sp. NPDC050406]|uniref:hypothetical protein n=1 Tax=Nocardia sp. NPDC050406 TaxID=3364318 RepID=UPI0037AAD371